MRRTRPLPRLAFAVSPPFRVVQVKERLTGAIILVALIVLLVPELLTGPVRSAPRVVTAAAAAEGAPLRSYTINLTDDAPSRRASSEASGPAQPAPLSAPAAAQSTPPAGAEHSGTTSPTPAAPAVQPPAAQAAGSASAPPAAATPRPRRAPSSAPAPQASATPAPGASGAEQWVVQLGSFASRANADHLAQQVRSGGFQASVSQAATGRKLYRVRVGPVRERAAATDLAARLRTAGHTGSVVPR